MYCVTAFRFASCDEWPPHPAATSRSASTADANPIRTGALVDQLDGGDAAVAVLEDELHETTTGREPARARPAPEGEALLLHHRAHRKRLERPRRNLDRLDAEHGRRTRDAVELEVAAVHRRRPRVAGGGIRGDDRIAPVRHQVERREEVAGFVPRQR